MCEFFRCSKILGEAGKQEILQQIFQKFYISNRPPNRYFPKIDVGAPDQISYSRASALYFVVQPIDSAPSGQIDKPSRESAPH